MTRSAALIASALAVLAAISTAAPLAEPPAQPLAEAFVEDDACDAVEGADGEACSMELRQLRGIREAGRMPPPPFPFGNDEDEDDDEDEDEDDEPRRRPTHRHTQESADKPAPAPAPAPSGGGEEASGPGFCCYAGASKANTCGTCFEDSKAPEGDYCASAEHCGGCGGTWCTAQCVFAGDDPSRVCETALPTAIAKESSTCSQSEDSCDSCGGSWCGVSTGDDAGGDQGQDEDEEAGFCCYSGASSSDVCGSCYEDSMAEEGSICAHKSKCGGCGGHWCKAQCVLKSKDPKNICATAIPAAIAESDSYCATTESHCISCKGTWCGVSETTDATDPSKDTPATTQAPEEGKNEDEDEAADEDEEAPPSTEAKA